MSSWSSATGRSGQAGQAGKGLARQLGQALEAGQERGATLRPGRVLAREEAEEAAAHEVDELEGVPGLVAQDLVAEDGLLDLLEQDVPVDALVRGESAASSKAARRAA